MILPKDVKGRKKIRNAKVCQMWLDDCLTAREIAEHFHISENRVGRILELNSHLLKYERDREKRKRIHWLKRKIKHRGDLTAKDTADLQEQLRKEMEGDAPLVDNRKFQIINYGDAKRLEESEKENENTPRHIPAA